MHRSSQSIAAIASALAKAQIELVNPEKTLTATIRDERRGQGSTRSFRYAPLSTGLDLVRKALGQHQIAVIQTTALDEATRTVRLNTLLAHSSGEWIASDWLVCAISDMNSPQRMGAALTYARRYGLFTLVGIAGEDDADAPDLNDLASEPATTELARSPGIAPAQPPQSSFGRTGDGSQRKSPLAANRSMLAPEESARLRQGMLAEIESIGSSSAATAWAHTMLRAKNTLTAEDARSVEWVFETKLAGLATDFDAGLAASDQAPQGASATPFTSADRNDVATDVGTAQPTSAVKQNSINRRLPVKKTVRHRNKEHLKFVRTQPCLICAKQPSDAHHLPFAQPRALGRKVSDEYVVPLCRAHHREVHRAARETPWWQSRGIAPLAVAEALWQQSQSGQALSEPLGSLTEPPQKRTSQMIGDNGLALEKPLAG